MTNAERFIGDEDLIDTFIDEFNEFACSEDIDFKYHYLKETLMRFFKASVKPQLTEDERVILRNIQKGLFREGFITRTTGNELNAFVKETGELIELYIFNHLFQFIKERRRIRDSRTFERRINNGTNNRLIKRNNKKKRGLGKRARCNTSRVY